MAKRDYSNIEESANYTINEYNAAIRAAEAADRKDPMLAGMGALIAGHRAIMGLQLVQIECLDQILRELKELRRGL